jgi:hypothetical protein
MSRKVLSILISLLIILLIAILIVPSVVYPESIIIDEINSGVKLSGDKKNPITGGWDGYVTETGSKEIVMSRFDVSNPVYTLVTKFSNESPSVSFQVIQLSRTNLVDFEILDYTIASHPDKPFQEAVEIARKYDLTKENPDPENITIFEPIELPEPTEADIRYDLCIEKIGSGEITTQEELLECNDLSNSID